MHVELQLNQQETQLFAEGHQRHITLEVK